MSSRAWDWSRYKNRHVIGDGFFKLRKDRPKGLVAVTDEFLVQFGIRRCRIPYEALTAPLTLLYVGAQQTSNVMGRQGVLGLLQERAEAGLPTWVIESRDPMWSWYHSRPKTIEAWIGNWQRQELDPDLCIEAPARVTIELPWPSPRPEEDNHDPDPDDDDFDDDPADDFDDEIFAESQATDFC